MGRFRVRAERQLGYAWVKYELDGLTGNATRLKTKNGAKTTFQDSHLLRRTES